MTTIDELIIQISADTKQLRSGFKKAEKTVDKTSKKMVKNTARLTAGLKKMKFAGIGAVLALSVMGKAMLNEIDVLQKLGKRLGTTTEFLSEMKFVAEQSGVAFNQLTTGFQLLQRNIGDAADGMGEAKQAFEALGLDAKKLIDLSLEDQFYIVSEAISNLENSTIKTQLAMDIFGRSGASLNQIIKDGIAPVKALAKETPNIISQETADNVAEFNDNMHKLVEVFKREALPAITLFAKRLNMIFDGLERGTKSERLKVIASEIEAINDEVIKLGGIKKLNSGAFLSEENNTKLNTSMERRNALLKEQRTIINSLKASKEDPKVEPIVLSDVEKAAIEAAKKAKKISDDIKKFMNESTDSWSTNFADEILDMGNGLQSFADLAKGIFRDIAREMIKVRITTPLVNAGVDILTNATSPTSPGASAPSSSLVATPSPTLSSRAPQQSQQQNITINQTIQPLTGIDDSQVSRIVAQQAPAIVEQAKAGTLQAIKNGGSARSVVRGAR
tara:strand:+ start:2584 stop:4095 length:1512 start_codon:yes stop_codon:yes gene_type:complete